MIPLTVVIPWSASAEACPHRRAAKAHVLRRVAQHLPAATVVVPTQESGDWNKPALVNSAVAQAKTDAVLVLDADICLPWPELAKWLQSKFRQGAILKPFGVVVRLPENVTSHIYSSANYSFCVSGHWPRVNELGGGAFVCHRADFAALRGMDERFSGQGWEDVDFGFRAKNLLTVEALNGNAYHMHHPRPESPAAQWQHVHANRKRYFARRAMGASAAVADTDSPFPAGPMPVRSAAPLAKPPAADVAIVCTMRTGGRGPRTYTREHALWLYRQCRRNVLNPRWEFVCFTDDANLLKNPPAGPFRAVPLKHGWLGWWAKLEMFRRDAWPARKPAAILALDLDTVIRHPFFVPAATKNKLRMLRAFTADKAGWMSGVMLWHGEDDYSRIPADFGKHQDAYMWCCRGQGGGDQEFIAFHQLLAGRGILPVDALLGVVPFGDAAKRPDAPIVPWWGTDKPWTKPTKFTPPFRADAGKTAIIGAWFGSLHDQQRLDATRRGVAEWARLNPRPKIVLVDASGDGEGPFPKIPGAVVVKVPVFPENDWLWHKEALWNIGAKKAMEDPAVSAMIFADADCHWPDCPEIASLVQDACMEHDWIQPFSVVRETSPAGKVVEYKSYAFAKAEGAQNIGMGQGFVHALSRRFYERFGGFDERGLEGGGDAVACIQTDRECRHSETALKNFHDLNKIIADYRGPKTPWTCIPVAMAHIWHGDRKGGADTRQYYARHLVWDVCGGRLNVAEKDPRNGLWRWMDTREARAAQDVRRRQKDLQTSADVKLAYDKLLASGVI